MAFVDALERYADEARDPRVARIVNRLTAPIRVVVRGRDGVGRRTVASALAGAGLSVTAAGADVGVVVVAEALKPEDRALIDEAGPPTVVVLNKADLTGFVAGGPLALAHRRAADYRAVTGVPTVLMIALLADAALDDDLLAALGALVTAPADLTSTDAFATAPHALPAEVRARLLAALDRFGIAHAVLALDSGAGAHALGSQLRKLSQVDRVLEHVRAAAAPSRYRRLQSAIAELRALAAQSGDDRLTELLCTDDAVLAAMTAAVHVVEAAGVDVDRGDHPSAHLRRAVHWRRFARGPVDSLHRACAADITRGSLRLLGRAR